MSEQTTAKADRILAQGRIEPETTPVRSFVVRGDTNDYRVIIGGSFQRCDCEHGQRVLRDEAFGRCSHIKAAVRWVMAEAEQHAGHPDALNDFERALRERKLREAERERV